MPCADLKYVKGQHLSWMVYERAILSVKRTNSESKGKGLEVGWEAGSLSLRNFPRIPPAGVSNGLCEHLRACGHCVYFCEHKQLLNFSCEQRAFEIIQMASSEHFRKIQMANSEHLDFADFPLAGISLLLIGNVVL